MSSNETTWPSSYFIDSSDKLAEVRENANDQLAIGFSLHLIGEESGANFLDQSSTVVRQKQYNHPTIRKKLSLKLFLRY